MKKGNKYAIKHGLSNTRIHRIWHSMYCRCYYKSTNGFERYGGRGIKVCDEWKHIDGFLNFYNWSISHGYAENLTLDRIDVNGDYCPDNCRWSTKEEQSRNMRSNRYIFYDNEKYTLSEICRKYNINVVTFCDRLKRGWSVEQALKISTKGNHRKVRL